jgi:hypothetical protein
MLGIARGVARRAGSALRGRSKSATRKDETGKNVRMSKDTGAGVMREVASGKGAKIQKTPAARKSRKAEGKAASDLKQPARGSLGKTAEDADSGLKEYQMAAKRANDFDKALAKKEKALKEYKEKADNLRGKERIKYIDKNRVRIQSLRDSIADMKSRGGPGGKSKRVFAKKVTKPKANTQKPKTSKKNIKPKKLTTGQKIGIGAGAGATGLGGIKLLSDKKEKKNMGGKVQYKMGGGKVVKKDRGGKIERTETPEQRHSRNRKKLSTNQEKELNKRLKAIGIGRKSGNISGTLRPGLRAAGKSADKRESKVDRSGQKRAAKQAVKTMAPASSMLFGDYDESKSKKKRKPSMEGDMIDLKGGGKIKGYKKGGPITYRMTGGQVVDNSYD